MENPFGVHVFIGWLALPIRDHVGMPGAPVCGAVLLIYPLSRHTLPPCTRATLVTIFVRDADTDTWKIRMEFTTARRWESILPKKEQ